MKILDILPNTLLFEKHWEKGNLSRIQLIKVLKNYLKNNAEVEELRRNSVNNHIIKVTMFYYKFLDLFGANGTSDKIMNLIHNKERYKNNNNGFGRDEFTKKASILHKKILKKAVIKIKSLLPEGWIISAKFDLMTLGSIANNQQIIIYIKRDYNKSIQNNKEYYHFTKEENIQNILKYGLKIGNNKRLAFDGYKDRIFLLPEFPTGDLIGQVITGSIFNEENPKIAIFKVFIPSDIKLYQDDQTIGFNGVYVIENIPPENLELVFNRSLNELP